MNPQHYYPWAGASDITSFSIPVGRLLCRHVRDILESERFAGRRINWIEGRGWFERLFTVVGPKQDVYKVAERIRLWTELNELIEHSMS